PTTLDVKPASGQQLDSVNKQYKVIVGIDHIDQVSQPAVAGNSIALANQQMLHFNGNLFFGPILTQFTSINNDPSVGYVSSPPTRIIANLGVDANSGFVAGKPAYTYGSGALLNVNLLPNGNAQIGSGSVPLNAP